VDAVYGQLISRGALMRRLPPPVSDPTRRARQLPLHPLTFQSISELWQDVVFQVERGGTCCVGALGHQLRGISSKDSIPQGLAASARAKPLKLHLVEHVGCVIVFVARYVVIFLRQAASSKPACSSSCRSRAAGRCGRTLLP
jgi:hypothetical protein